MRTEEWKIKDAGVEAQWVVQSMLDKFQKESLIRVPQTKAQISSVLFQVCRTEDT